VSSSQPHNSLFHKAFSDLENAAGQLRAVLPQEIAARIDWRTLRLEDGHDFDEQLTESHSDLVYTARLEGHQVVLYVLFEHQSTSDPWMAFRLLRYTVRIWERWRAAHEQAKTLPPIIPVVLSHAEGGWKAARSMHELFGMSELHAEMLGPYLPQFRYVLDDLSRRSDEELMARALGALDLLALLLLRHGRDKRDFLQRLVEWAALFRSVWQAEDGREALGTLVRYAALANDTVTMQDLSDTLVPLLDEAALEVIMTEGQRLCAERGEQAVNSAALRVATG
jgi:predicted transposase/invertase (TIGR01784 family)